MNDLKLLTEAEWMERLAAWSVGYLPLAIAELRERGMIAPEPDTLGKEANRILEAWPGNAEARWVALAALKRGMELQREAQPALTVEAVRRAVIGALLTDGMIEAFVTRLHTAPTGATS